jgi:hypothetical protein
MIIMNFMYFVTSFIRCYFVMNVEISSCFQVDIEGSTYTHFILLSGGIGVTPMLATAQQLAEQQSRGRPLDLCWFVWGCREAELVEAVLPLEPTTNTATAPSAPSKNRLVAQLMSGAGSSKVAAAASDEESGQHRATLDAGQDAPARQAAKNVFQAGPSFHTEVPTIRVFLLLLLLLCDCCSFLKTAFGAPKLKVLYCPRHH